MANLNEACWDGYTQKGMKKVKGRMVPNCVPMEENIFRLIQAAKTPLRKPEPRSTTELPSASGVVRGGQPEPKVHVVNDPEDTGYGFDPDDFGAAIEKLKQKKLEEASNDMYTLEQFMGMLEEAGYPMDEGAKEYFQDLIQRKLLGQTPEPDKPDFKKMTPRQRREYVGTELERRYSHMPLDILSRLKGTDSSPLSATARQSQQRARYALSEPMTENDEIDEYCPRCMMEVLKGQHPEQLGEAQYQGRKVSLGKPFRTSGGPKKFSVYVKNKNGNIIKVNFGDPNMKIKKNIPNRRKSFRARHKCHTAKDRTSARYWSCRAW